MAVRRAIAMAVTLAVVALGSAQAQATEPKVFLACATFTARAHYCLKTISVIRGDTVWIRTKVKPPHGGQQVIVQNQNPGRVQWNTFDTLTLSDGGRAKTSWETGPGTADSHDPYHFRFKIPNVGLSNEVAVWVLPG
jgi:hypothetical protein